MLIEKAKKYLNQLTQSLTTTNLCKCCFKEIKWSSLCFLLSSNPQLCSDCYKKLIVLDEKLEVDGVKGEILFEYKDYLREILFKFKGCDDYELKDVFLEKRRLYLSLKYRGYTLINVPSNIDEDERRGYNHVIEMFSCLNLPYLSIVKKKEAFKQSDLLSKEREKVLEKLEIEDVDLSDKKILIVDDVTTTGSTLKAMITLIKSKNPKDIKFIIMSKHIMYSN